MIIIKNQKKNNNDIVKLEYIIKNNFNMNIIGYIICIINFIENNGIITTFNTFINNKGYGSYLLKVLIKDIVNKYPYIKKIILDDMSDRFRKKNNIYINNGFRYLEDSGPEMELLLYNNRYE